MARLPSAITPTHPVDGNACIVSYALNECTQDRTAFKHTGFGLPQHQHDIYLELLELLHVDITIDRAEGILEWMRFRHAKPAVFRAVAKDKVHGGKCSRCSTKAKLCQLPNWFSADDKFGRNSFINGKNEWVPDGECVITFARGLMYPILGLPPIWQFDKPTDWPLLDREMAYSGIGPWAGNPIRVGTFVQRTNAERFPDKSKLQEMLKSQADIDDILAFESPDRS